MGRFSASICAITRSACFPTLSHWVSCCWLKPNVVLMDLLMPKMDGVAATEAVRAELPGVEVVALTSVLEDAAVTGAVRAGVIGYLLKDTKAEELCRAIKGAATGRVQLSPKAAARLMRDAGRPDHHQAAASPDDVLRPTDRGRSLSRIIHGCGARTLCPDPCHHRA